MSSSDQHMRDALRDLAKLPEEMAPLFQSLEDVRQEYQRKRAKANAVSLIIGVVCLVIGLVLVATSNEPIMALVVGGIALLFILLCRYVILGGALSQYCSRFKSELFTQVTKRLAPEIEYQPDRYRSEQDLENTGLISSRIDRYSGQDYFGGKYGDTQLEFSEVHAERRETTRDSKGRTRTRWVTVFRGIFLSADFHKHFQGQVLIEPDIAEAAFGWLGRKIQGISGDLVRLESPEFEAAFKVRASDQVEARYLITPTMQERLLEMQNTWGRGFMVSLNAGWVHVLIPKTNDWFECTADVAATDPTQLQTFAHELLRVMDIIDTLDLNTRLWTKT